MPSSSKIFLQLRSTSRHHDVRRPGRRESLAVDVGVVQEVHAVDDHALLGRRLPLEHPVAIDDARVLLNHVVAGAGRVVVAVGPDRRAGVIREERPVERVAIVRPERIGRRADRVAHRVRAGRWRRRRLSGRRRLTALTAAGGRLRLDGIGRRRNGGARRRGLPFHGKLSRRGRLADGTLSRDLELPWLNPPEDRHHDQPALRELIVADHGVAVVARFTDAPEAGEHLVRGDGPVEDLPRGLVARALLRKHGQARVDDVDDVIGTDGDAGVRRAAAGVGPLRPFEPDAKAVEAVDEDRGRLRARRRLFDRGSFLRDDRHCGAGSTGSRCATRSSPASAAMPASKIIVFFMWPDCSGGLTLR